MPHPLASWNGRQSTTAFWLLVALTLIVLVVLQVVGLPLQTAAAPQGIVSFELAGLPATTQAILDSWDPNARVHVGFSLGLDFLFMPLYAATIALGCLWGAGVLSRRRWPLAALGRPLAWGVWLAVLCDVVENIALWRLLAGPVTAPWPARARWCAMVKFGLLGLGLVYVMVAVAAWATNRRNPATEVAG